ncbi:Uncharacterized protein BM_BM13585, partial [Brugia malayi]|uniref:Bm13585 n=1 Tax=Brugia malayi TaxID=6279 RepID=A0A0K0IY83_BRUMA
VLNFHSYITDEKQLTVDLEKIRENIAFLLRPYFYDESINEIITEQLS